MRTIIVEDEPQIRAGVKVMLKAFPSVEVIAEAATKVEARELIETLKPDLVLMDIRLEDGNSFDLLQSLGNPGFALIFITAYDEYAIRAFKYNALDYLLKPIDPDELKIAINKAAQNRELINQAQIDNLVKKNMQPIQIIVRTVGGHIIIPLSQLIFCRADEGYTHFILVNGKKYISSKPLKEYDGLLPSADFIRIHQSYLVNINYVEKYTISEIYLKDIPASLPIAIRRKTAVITSLNQKK